MNSILEAAKEIVELKNTLKEKDAKIEALKVKLANLDEQKLKSNAVFHSQQMFNEYMAMVFKKLGLNLSYWQAISYTWNMEKKLGDKWFESDDIKVELGAHIVGEIKTAYLKIGLKTDYNE